MNNKLFQNFLDIASGFATPWIAIYFLFYNYISGGPNWEWILIIVLFAAYFIIAPVGIILWKDEEKTVFNKLKKKELIPVLLTFLGFAGMMIFLFFAEVNDSSSRIFGFIILYLFLITLVESIFMGLYIKKHPFSK